MIKIQIKTIFEAVIFEHEKKNNTILETVNAAFAADADLRRADLRRANLSTVKNDFFEILLNAKKEVPGLRQALINGKINGTTYSGECACLVGTIANVRGCKYENLEGINPNSSRPAEVWFLNIKEGTTPENSQVAEITLGWIDEFLKLKNL